MLLLVLVLGFSPANFVGVERGEVYGVQAGYLTGRPSVVAIFDLQLEFGSAGELPPSGSSFLSPYLRR